MPLIDFDAASEWEMLLFHQRQVLSRQQALRFLTASAIRHRLGTSRWQQPHRAVYVTTTGELTWSQMRWVALLYAAPEPEQMTAFIAGRAALELHGVRNLRNIAVEVLVSDARQLERAPKWAIVHRTSRLPKSEIQCRGSMPCTIPERSMVDAAQWASSDREARMLIAMSFQQRVVGLTAVNRVLTGLPMIRRQSLIARTAIDAAGGAHSLAELEFLRLSRSAGFPEPKLQYVRRDATGRRRYLDAYYEKYGIHVEIDGVQHADPSRAWADMERQNQLWIRGDRVLRFPAWLVRERSAEVIRQVRAALIAAGWRP
jgi:hypothetical protein